MNTTPQSQSNKTVHRAFSTACLASYKRLIAEIEKAKDTILAEFLGTRGAHEQLLRLALNEAEALAWETEFPQLVFPTLAMEKAQAVAVWEARQQSIRRVESTLPLAA